MRLVAIFALGWAVSACDDPILIDFYTLDGAVGDESPIDPVFPDGSSDGQGCVNLQCQQIHCDNGATTSVSGTVYAPNGTLPLYNVIVYVPNRDLDPLTAGVTCDKCGVLSSGSPLTVALTDPKGHFTLNNVPVGANIPLVMQVGKWRKKIAIPKVSACVDNPVGQKVGGVEHLTRLPSNQTQGEMPKIAITTGGCDKLACIMRKIGIDSVEYAPGSTNAAQKPKAAVSFYNGYSGIGPAGSPDATYLWSDTNQLKNFDIAIFSCECQEAPSTKDATSYAAVRKYLEAGGRVFTTDYQYTWYKFSSDSNLTTSPWNWSGGAPPGTSPFVINQTFPKGHALADWLFYVSSIAPYNAQTTQPPVKGQFPVASAWDNIHGYNPKYGVSWATEAEDGDPKFVTMNMPSSNSPDQQCGKAVHLDAHISVTDVVDTSFPGGCTGDLKETELATVFFLFDLSSCIQNDTGTVLPPILN